MYDEQYENWQRREFQKYLDSKQDQTDYGEGIAVAILKRSIPYVALVWLGWWVLPTHYAQGFQIIVLLVGVVRFLRRLKALAIAVALVGLLIYKNMEPPKPIPQATRNISARPSKLRAGRPSQYSLRIRATD